MTISFRIKDRTNSGQGGSLKPPPQLQFIKSAGPVVCIMVAPFPPPVTGNAVVTAALREALIFAGHQVHEINSGAGRLAREPFFQKAARRLRLTLMFARSVRQNSRTRVYISFAGGGGQVGDLFNVFLARLSCHAIIFHHHSFAYFDKPRFLPRCVFALAGPRTRHIFLSDKMRRKATQHYGSVRRGYVLSNAAFIGPPRETCRSGSLRKIGFLSNIGRTKGIDRFLELARRLREKRLSICFEVAGPCLDQFSQGLIEAAVGQELITYHGALEGEAKQNFLDAIDVLVFPSRYRHEAEPLVILEALARGVPVIASDRGCIAELLGKGGVLLDADAEDLAPALQQIEQWLLEPEIFDKARGDAIALATSGHEKSLRNLHTIMRHM